MKKKILVPILAAIALAAAVPVLAGSSCGTRKLNVLLITMDTTRADRLRCYGFNHIETPSLNQIAAQGVLFKNAYSHVPLTLPAHTAMLTSTVPAYNSVIDNGAYQVEEKLVTLAEILKDDGYDTAAFISAVVLYEQFNLDQGFDVYNQDDIVPQKGGAFLVSDRPANLTTDAALKWLEQDRQKPFFLWIHYYDPHAEYKPPPPYDKIYPSPYYGEIAFMDSQIGRVLKSLEDRKLDRNTIVVAIADHGESLGEHLEATHGYFVYNSTLHIPFIMKVPGREGRKGKTVNATVRQIDLMPTLLDYLGLTPPPEAQGESLRPILEVESEPTDERWTYGESKYTFLHYNWSPLTALIGSRYKYIKAPKPEFYDLKDDPGELSNLIQGYKLGDDGALAAMGPQDGYTASPPPPLDQLAPETRKLLMFQKDMLERLEKNWAQKKLESKKAELSRREMDQLEALGYIVGGQGGDPKLALKKNPRDFADLFRMFQLLRSEFDEDDFEKVLETADVILKRDPENPEGLNMRADALYSLGRFQDAIDAYNHVSEIHGETYARQIDIASIYIRLSQVDPNIAPEKKQVLLLQAKASLDKSIELEKDNPIAHYFLGRILIELGDFDAALKNLNVPGLIDTELGDVGLAYYQLVAKGDAGLAESYYQKAEKLAGEKSVVYWQEYAQFLFYVKKDYPKVVELLEKAIAEDASLKTEVKLMEVLAEAKQLAGEGPSTKEPGSGKN